MTRPFLLRPEDLDRLKEAKRIAMANPIPLAVVMGIAATATEDAYGVIRGERPEGAPHVQEVELPFGWRVNISCEEQPPGPCLHISMSSPTPAKSIPGEHAVKMVLDVLGCGAPLKGWIEQFEEGGKVAGNAVNVVVAL